MATLLIDGENVRRSIWPNIPREELERLAEAWASATGNDAIVVWEGADTADDRIAREAGRLEPPVWVATSDRELRDRLSTTAERIIGGGSFARDLKARAS